MGNEELVVHSHLSISASTCKCSKRYRIRVYHNYRVVADDSLNAVFN